VLRARARPSYAQRALKLRVVLLVALTGSVGACNAILGNSSLIAGEGGTDAAGRPDTSQVDGTMDGQGTSDVHADADADAGRDAPDIYSKFCTHLAKTDAQVIFCDDFDPDGGGLVPFTPTRNSGGELTTVADASCRTPPCMQATVPASDGGTVPAAFVIYALENDADASAVPSYFACDLLVDSHCLQSHGSLSVTRLASGAPSNPPNVYVEAQNAAFNLGWFEGMGTYSGPDANPSGDVSLEAGAWVRLWLKFVPLRDGTIVVTLAQGDAGSVDVPDTVLPGQQGVFKPDGGIPGLNSVAIRFGLRYESGETPACTIYYDNIVVGPFAK
jgi:hypothetical protein